ncbi:branched-chain amino acid transport system II carrier protein, partial [Staphylococcus sp. SIMBA_130]
VNDKGVSDRKNVSIAVLEAGILAAIGLTAIYLSLAYIGATSTSLVGSANNGGAILSSIASYLFGSLGTLLLGAAITFACLTTSVG